MAIARVLKARLAGVIAARLVVSSLLLGSAVAIGVANADTFPVAPLVALIALTYALSVGYLATLRLALRFPILMDLQFALDAVLVSGCVYFTGGIASHFSSLYVLPVIAASTLRARRGAIQVAALSATLYTGVVTAQYLEVGLLPGSWWHPLTASLPSVVFAQYTVITNLGGMFVVALLSGSLANRLRSARAGLEDATDEIADLRAFNEHVIDCLTAGLITTDASCRILTFNRAAARITSTASENARGRDVRDILQLADDKRALLVATAGEHRRVEIPYVAGSASLELGLTISALQFPEGTAGFLIVFQDITEFKRLERDARLQQRLSAVGDMAAGIAHEIRNPLAAMSGSIELLKGELPLSEEQGQLMDIVLRESERLNETIRLFLSYAQPQRQPVYRLDARAVLRDAALALRTSVDARNEHTITVDVPEEPLWYDGDETEMRQVLWSLGTNGLRAMPTGGRLAMSARVESPVPARADLVFAVRDFGCGIPSDQLDGVFQPFRSSFRKGAGLGLAIVHRIVTDYGGSLHVSSTVGEGTTISVRLPMPPASVTAVQHVLPPGRTA